MLGGHVCSSQGKSLRLLRLLRLLWLLRLRVLAVVLSLRTEVLGLTSRFGRKAGSFEKRDRATLAPLALALLTSGGGRAVNLVSAGASFAPRRTGDASGDGVADPESNLILRSDASTECALRFRVDPVPSWLSTKATGLIGRPLRFSPGSRLAAAPLWKAASSSSSEMLSIATAAGRAGASRAAALRSAAEHRGQGVGGAPSSRRALLRKRCAGVRGAARGGAAA